MAKFPVFNYKPLEDLYSFVQGLDSAEGSKLLENLIGKQDCCFGNPCYYKACLACFCRGNIRYLTQEQAKTQGCRDAVRQRSIEYGERRGLITREVFALDDD